LPLKQGRVRSVLRCLALTAAPAATIVEAAIFSEGRETNP